MWYDDVTYVTHTQVANDAALSRVDRLEQLLTNQLMRLAGDLRYAMEIGLFCHMIGLF